MRERREYTESFRQQALEKVFSRGSNSIRVVAEDLNMSLGTLRNWMKADRDSSRAKAGLQSKRPQDWSLTDRLQILMESHGLDEEALNALCREKGVFRHHLEQWQAAFTAGGAVDNRSQLRELKDTNKALKRELNRKEKALAEAAALLVLQKKYQALWEEKDA
jgi:transposase-like protein